MAIWSSGKNWKYGFYFISVDTEDVTYVVEDQLHVVCSSFFFPLSYFFADRDIHLE